MTNRITRSHREKLLPRVTRFLINFAVVWLGGMATFSSTKAFAIQCTGPVIITVNTSASHTGQGTITGGPSNQINCTQNKTGPATGSCSWTTQPSSTPITFTASPASGSTIADWGVTGCAGVTSCQIVPSCSLTITPVFNTIKYSLTVTKTGQGTVTSDTSPNLSWVNGPPAQGSASYDSGSTVTLSLTPADATWTADAPSGCTSTTTVNGIRTCTVLMNGNKSVTTSFSQATAAVTVSNFGGDGNGSIKYTAGGNVQECSLAGGPCSRTFVQGTSVKVEGFGDANSDFMGFTAGPCSGQPSSCTSTAPYSAYAKFLKKNYTVTVSSTGGAGGSFTSNSATNPFNCTFPANSSTVCTKTFPRGSSFTLTPGFTVGSSFLGWAGGCTGGPNSLCNISNLSQDTNIVFQTATAYTLSVKSLYNGSTRGGGSVTSTSPDSSFSCPANSTSDCTKNYPLGTKITLRAAESAGYAFVGWDGPCEINATAPKDCTISFFNASTTITAKFAPSFTLTAVTLLPGTPNALVGDIITSPVVAGSPTMNCPTTGCTQSYASGSTISLRATARPNYKFVQWQPGACSVSSSAPDTCVVNNLSANQTVTAEYAPARQLNVAAWITSQNKAGGGQVNSITPDTAIACNPPGGTCSAYYAPNTSVTLRATASAGFALSSWSGVTCPITGDCTVTMNISKLVTANFSPLPNYLLTARNSISGTITLGGGSISSTPSSVSFSCAGEQVCSSSYPSGSQFELVATANPGYTHVGWSGACTQTGTANCIINDFTSNKDVTALFEETVIPFAVTWNVTKNQQYKPGGTWTEGPLPNVTVNGLDSSVNADFLAKLSFTFSARGVSSCSVVRTGGSGPVTKTSTGSAVSQSLTYTDELINDNYVYTATCTKGSRTYTSTFSVNTSWDEKVVYAAIKYNIPGPLLMFMEVLQKKRTYISEAAWTGGMNSLAPQWLEISSPRTHDVYEQVSENLGDGVYTYHKKALPYLFKGVKYGDFVYVFQLKDGNWYPIGEIGANSAASEDKSLDGLTDTVVQTKVTEATEAQVDMVNAQGFSMVAGLVPGLAGVDVIANAPTLASWDTVLGLVMVAGDVGMLGMGSACNKLANRSALLVLGAGSMRVGISGSRFFSKEGNFGNGFDAVIGGVEVFTAVVHFLPIPIRLPKFFTPKTKAEVVVAVPIENLRLTSERSATVIEAIVGKPKQKLLTEGLTQADQKKLLQSAPDGEFAPALMGSADDTIRPMAPIADKFRFVEAGDGVQCPTLCIAKAEAGAPFNPSPNLLNITPEASSKPTGMILRQVENSGYSRLSGRAAPDNVLVAQGLGPDETALANFLVRSTTGSGGTIVDAGNAVMVLNGVTQSGGKTYLVLTYVPRNKVGGIAQFPSAEDLKIAYQGTALNGLTLSNTAMVIDTAHPLAQPILLGLYYEAFLASVRRALVGNSCLGKVNTRQLIDTRLLALKMASDPLMVRGYAKWRQAASGQGMTDAAAKAEILRRIDELFDETGHAKYIQSDIFASLTNGLSCAVPMVPKSIASAAKYGRLANANLSIDSLPEKIQPGFLSDPAVLKAIDDMKPGNAYHLSVAIADLNDSTVLYRATTAWRMTTSGGLITKPYINPKVDYGWAQDHDYPGLYQGVITTTPDPETAKLLVNVKHGYQDELLSKIRPDGDTERVIVSFTGADLKRAVADGLIQPKITVTGDAGNGVGAYKPGECGEDILKSLVPMDWRISLTDTSITELPASYFKIWFRGGVW